MISLDAVRRISSSFFVTSLFQGLRIGSLPPFIGPVFTFSNASSCRANYDEVQRARALASAPLAAYLLLTVAFAGLRNGYNVFRVGGLRSEIQDLSTRVVHRQSQRLCWQHPVCPSSSTPAGDVRMICLLSNARSCICLMISRAPSMAGAVLRAEMRHVRQPQPPWLAPAISDTEVFNYLIPVFSPQALCPGLLLCQRFSIHTSLPSTQKATLTCTLCQSNHCRPQRTRHPLRPPLLPLPCLYLRVFPALFSQGAQFKPFLNTKTKAFPFAPQAAGCSHVCCSAGTLAPRARLVA